MELNKACVGVLEVIRIESMVYHTGRMGWINDEEEKKFQIQSREQTTLDYLPH